MRKILQVLAVMVLGAGPVFAESPSTQPSNIQAMQQRIHDLESRVNDLESRKASPSNDRLSPADVSAVERAVLADADQHTQMNVLAFPSGYDSQNGFVLQSSDGNFSIHPGALFQFRFNGDTRNDVPNPGGGIAGGQGGDGQTGFELTRMRLSLDGNLFNPQITYYFQVGQDTNMGAVSLFDAYLVYRVSAQSPLALKAGQFKDPVWHEKNIYPSNLMAADRSLVDAFVGGGQTARVQGAAMVYDLERFRGQAAFHDGYNSANTPAFSAGGLGVVTGAGGGLLPTNWGGTVRAEYLLIGDRKSDFNPFSEYDQFSAKDDKQTILVVGGGADYSEAGANKILFHTVDAQLNMTNGWAFYAAYLGAYRDLLSNKGVAPGSYYDSGFLLQGSYMMTSQLEPFARYDYTHLDGKAEPGIVKDSLHEITIGANYYLYDQHMKVTIDGTWLPNGSPADVPILGILKDDGHNELLGRIQLQLWL